MPRISAVQHDKPPFTVEALSRHILELLPQDGAALLNRILHVKLSNKLHTDIDRDLFLEARDLLLKKGAVGRLPGQGGKLFLSAKPVIETANPSTHTDDEPWSEAQLMVPLGAYLANGFRDESKKTGEWFVRDTSRLGGIGGRWRVPTLLPSLRHVSTSCRVSRWTSTASN